MKTASSSPFTVNFAGRDFVVAKETDQVGFKGAITYEKRALNRLFAAHVLKPSARVLDAYAGYGISTHDWLSSGASVLAIEKSATNFACLKVNCAAVPADRLEIRRANNLTTLPALFAAGKRFDMIDLDPFGNAFQQISLSLPLISSGYLWVTSGEHVNIRRKLNRDVLTARYGDAVSAFYERTRPVTEYPRVLGDWIKTLRSDARLVNFCMSPGCLRMLFAIDRAVPRPFLRAWAARPKFFGGLEKLAS